MIMSEINRLIIHCDGACDRNPGGLTTWGWSASLNGKEIKSGYGSLGRGPMMSSVVGEFTAVINAMRWAKDNYSGLIEIRSDSRFVVDSINKNYNVQALRVVNLHREAVNLFKQLIAARLIWVSRWKNKRADELTRIAYREAKKLEQEQRRKVS